MIDGLSTAKSIIGTYLQIYQNLNLEEAATQKTSLYLPQFSSEEIEALLREIQEIFSKEPVCLEINGPVNVIGDLHGHILDLFRDLQTIGLPTLGDNSCKFLFLGDLVDRGEFSLETITLVFSLKVAYPDNVYIIRGNHEFEFLNQRCGFIDDILKIYGQQCTLYSKFKTTFSYIPITALIEKTILCVHGGLGPNWFSLNQAKKIERPIEDFGEDLIDAMLWSDPSESIDFYEPSNRGTGFFFGEASVSDFLDSNSLKILIRAHECVNNGAQAMFNGKLITVFGASNYCGLISNSSAILSFNENGDYEIKQFPPLPYLKRESVTFQKLVDGKLISISQKKISNNQRGSPVLSKPGIPGISRNGRQGRVNPSSLKLPPLSGGGAFTPRGAHDFKVHRPMQPQTARGRNVRYPL